MAQYAQVSSHGGLIAAPLFRFRFPWLSQAHKAPASAAAHIRTRHTVRPWAHQSGRGPVFPNGRF